MTDVWVKYLPKFIRRKLESRLGLQAIIANTGWLFADKILRMGVGLFIGVWIARYLGPEQFGLWNFALAFTALFGAFATLGLDGIVIRKLVKDPERQNEILGSAFALKIIGGAITLLIAILSISVVRSGETLTLWLVGLSAAGSIFQSVNVIDFYFQAKVQSRYTVYAANGAFVLMTLVKIILLLTSAPLIAFAWAGLGEIALTAIFLLVAYQVNHHNMREWRYDGWVARALLKDSWPLILTGLAIMIYMRIDQLMLGQILGNKSVGIYSVALRLSEAWYFIPVAIVASVYPSIIMSKQQGELFYLARLQKLYNLMVILALSVAIPMTFLSGWVVNFLYGKEYIEAGGVLAVHIWGAIFVFFGCAWTSWMLTEGYQKTILAINILSLLSNVALNFILIPKYGTTGAALATAISYSLGHTFFAIFFKNQKIAVIMLWRSFNFFRRPYL